MTRNEYISKSYAMQKELRALRERYKALWDELEALRHRYKNSPPVKPQQIVEVNGQRLWLERYKLVGYSVRPVLYPLNGNGEPDKRRVKYVDNWQDMTPAE